MAGRDESKQGEVTEEKDGGRVMFFDQTKKEVNERNFTRLEKEVEMNWGRAAAIVLPCWCRMHGKQRTKLATNWRAAGSAHLPSNQNEEFDGAAIERPALWQGSVIPPLPFIPFLSSVFLSFDQRTKEIIIFPAHKWSIWVDLKYTLEVEPVVTSLPLSSAITLFSFPV